MKNLITLTNICKKYHTGENHFYALKDVCINIEEGEMVAISGSSGSGKSTLMNIIGCLDIPSSGEYVLGGDNVSQLRDNQLSKIRNLTIGFVFQSFNLISGFTALENVELPLVYRGIAKKQRKKLALEALEKVGLGDRITHRPNQLSGGQQQRVAIARAIAASPPLILADEPTGNLDRTSSEQIMETLIELHKEGHTIILITHDEKLATQMPRLITISDGIVV